MADEPLDLAAVAAALDALVRWRERGRVYGDDAKVQAFVQDYAPALLRVVRALYEALEAQGNRALDDAEDWCCCGHAGSFDGTADSGHLPVCRQARAALALVEDKG